MERLSGALLSGAGAALGGNRRWASSKLFKAKPRPYKKRLWDRVMAPVVKIPAELQHPGSRCTAAVAARRRLPSQIDVAHAEELRRLLLTAPLVAVAHRLPADARTVHYDAGRLRKAGLRLTELRHRDPEELLRLAVDGTRLEPLVPLLTSDFALLTADDMHAPLKALIAFNKSMAWLNVLGVVLEQKRILRLNEAAAIAALPFLDVLPAQTLALLRRLPSATLGLLGAPAAATQRTLAARLAQLQEEKK